MPGSKFWEVRGGVEWDGAIYVEGFGKGPESTVCDPLDVIVSTDFPVSGLLCCS
jgi:hypothetical protein